VTPWRAVDFYLYAFGCSPLALFGIYQMWRAFDHAEIEFTAARNYFMFPSQSCKHYGRASDQSVDEV